MPSFDNIERSAFMKGYIGYAAGTVWRIRKEARGFRAFCNGETFWKQTLAGVSYELERRAAIIIAARKYGISRLNPLTGKPR